MAVHLLGVFRFLRRFKMSLFSKTSVRPKLCTLVGRCAVGLVYGHEVRISTVRQHGPNVLVSVQQERVGGTTDPVGTRSKQRQESLLIQNCQVAL